MVQKLDEEIDFGIIDTPLGPFQIGYKKEIIYQAYFRIKSLDNTILFIDNQFIRTISKQFQEYFSGRRKSFEFKLAPDGTIFQKNVWQKLQSIPFGETRSYQEIAIALGGKDKTRAVATAIAKNPLLIFIPCHRVIGTNGKLTGFSGGLERKSRLLEFEGNRIDF